MKSKLTITFFLLLSFISESQNYFGNDACWTSFTYNMFSKRMVYEDQFFLEGDTVLNGKTYRKLIGRSTYSVPDTYFYGAIREELGKVYNYFTDYNTHVSGEYLLYDFNVKVGDTIYSTVTAGELSRKPVVTKIDTIELLTGEKRKRYYLNGSPCWIEGIGNLGGFFNQTHEIVTNGSIEHIVCFKKNGIEYYKYDSYCPDGTCCDVLTGLESYNLSNSTVTLSPNPTNRFVRLDLSKSMARCVSIKLINALGNTLLSSNGIKENTDFEIDLTNCSLGLYFVVIEFEKNSEIHKLIKI